MKKYNHRYEKIDIETILISKPKTKIPSPLLTSALTLSESPTIVYSLVGTSNCPICQEKSLYEKVVTWKDCSHTVITIPQFTLE